MNEMYWITRLDYINFTIVMCIITFILLIIMCSFSITNNLEEIDSIPDYKIEKKNKLENEIKESKKYIKIFSSCIFVFFLMFIFIPSEKDMYKIIGIGGTFDYLKSNDKAKKLPDKCIDALDKFISQNDSIK